MALAAQVQTVLARTDARRASAALGLGVVGASLFYGDSLITPAISVLSAVEGVARLLAGFLAQVELEVRPFGTEAREHRRKEERRDRRDHAHAQFAVKRAALRAGHFGQFLGFAKHPDRLIRDLLAERREPDHAPGSLDQSEAEQRLQFAQARGERRLGDEAGVRRFSEVTEPAQGDQILELLDGRQMDNHLSRNPITDSPIMDLNDRGQLPRFPSTNAKLTIFVLSAPLERTRAGTQSG